jgi:transcriptional regulator with XRE-family HTH domain
MTVTFGQAVASKRKSRQISQKQLASMILKEDGTPISPQYLNDIERDRRNPPGDHLISQFSKALDVPEEYFYYLANQIPPKYRESSPTPTLVQEAFEAFARSYRRGKDVEDK